MDLNDMAEEYASEPVPYTVPVQLTSEQVITLRRFIDNGEWPQPGPQQSLEHSRALLQAVVQLRKGLHFCQGSAFGTPGASYAVVIRDLTVMQGVALRTACERTQPLATGRLDANAALIAAVIAVRNAVRRAGISGEET